MNISDIILRLDGLAAILWQLAASAAALSAAVDETRGIVRAIDEAAAGLQERRSQALAAMTQPATPLGRSPPHRKPIAKVVTDLQTLDAEKQQLAVLRELAASLAAQLDARAREAEKAQAKRDEARKPLANETRRAQELALKFARYPALAERVVELLIIDVKTRPLAANSYGRVPRGTSAAIGYGPVFVPPRVIAVPAIMSKLALPIIRNGSWVDSYFKHGSEHDLRNIQNPAHEVAVRFVAELIELSRASSPTMEAVDRAVVMVDARLVAEFAKVISEIAELKALDATVDRSLRYADGALVYADEMFPDWVFRMMPQWIALPDFGGYRAAAE